jgi:hypothetical protein
MRVKNYKNYGENQFFQIKCLLIFEFHSSFLLLSVLKRPPHKLFSQEPNGWFFLSKQIKTMQTNELLCIVNQYFSTNFHFDHQAQLEKN